MPSLFARVAHHYRWPDLLGMCVTVGLIVMLAWLGYLVYAEHRLVSLVWPASGVALGVLLHFGLRYWPAVLLGGVLASLFVGNPWSQALPTAVGGLLEALFAWYLLKQPHLDFDLELRRPGDFMRLVLVSVLAANVAAIIGGLSLLLNGLLAQPLLLQKVMQWWQGDLLGLVIFTPLVLVWSRGIDRQLLRSWRGLECLACLGLSWLAGQVILLDWWQMYFAPVSNNYWMFLFVAWAAVRCGPQMVTLVMAMFLTQGLLGATLEVGAFALDARQTGMENFWFFSMLLGGVGFSLASMVTEQQQTARALMAEKQALDDIINSLPGIFYLFDEQGRLMRWNSSFAAVSGYTEQELAGAPVYKFIPSEDHELIAARIMDVFLQGEAVAEAGFLCRHGQVIPYHFTGRRSVIDGRQYLIGVGEDISERQRIEQQIRDSEERYRLLFEQNQTYLMLVDRAGVVLMINRNNARLLGGEPSDFVGMSAYDLFPQEIREAIRQRSEAVLAGGGRSVEGQAFEDCVRIGGQEYWFNSHVSPARTASGEVYGLQMVAVNITERKQAELRLRENESRYRQLFENTATNITIVDGAGNILMLNEANARMLGGRPEEFIGRNLRELDPEHADGFVERYHQVLATREPMVVEDPFPLPDGLHWFRAHLQPLFDLDDQAVAVQVMAFDITDRKQMEQALQESERVWRFAFEGAGDAVWDWNLNTGRIDYSPQWKILLGYGEDDVFITVEDWRAIIHPEDIERVVAHHEILMHSPEGCSTVEARIRCKDGSWRWIITRSQVVSRNDCGAPTRILGVNTDVTERRQMEDALRRSEELWKFALEGAGDTVWDFDMAHGRIYQSSRYKALLGYTDEDVLETLADWHSLIHPDDVALIVSNHQALLAGVTHMSSVEVRMRCKDGSWKWILSRGMVVSRDEQGRPVRVVGTNTDTTERKQLEESLRRSEEYWKFALEGSGDAVWDWDIASRQVNYSPRLWEMLGYDEPPYQGGTMDQDNWRINIHPEDQLAADANGLRLLEQGSSTAELRMRCKDGSYKWMLARGMVVARAEDGTPLRIIGTNTDISALKDHQQQLEHLAHFDPLTQLPNRVLLAYRLQQAMTQCQRRQQSLAVVYLDLDGFKIINDSHGHDVGDQLLVQVAQRMKAALREGDTLARIGGDEFIAVLSDLNQPQDCEPVLDRLLQAAGEPVLVADRHLRVSASLGVTLYPGDGSDAEQLIRHADQSMYQAKQAGKNRYHLFDVDRDAAVQQQHETIGDIRRGLRQQEFVLHYQPKVNMRNGQMVGVEALIRWQHPRDGWLPPDRFLPLIEEQEVCVDVGAWVIDSALAQMAVWHQQGLEIPVSVNITAYHLRRHDFTDMLAAALQRHPQVAPQLLELEILETGAFDDLDEVAAIMEACHQLGVVFALDDFGTGYSSLTYLKRLPAGQLKIDRSFVCDMLEDPDDLAIVEGVVGLAHAFSRRAIAEGVESAAHGELLLQLGCDLAQGYGIARPMPAADLVGWLANWRPDPSWLQQAEQPLVRDNLPLVFGEVRHRHWLRGIEAWLTGQRTQAPRLALEECHLTHWLRGYGAEHYGHLEGWQEMVALHERLHGAGQTLCQSHELPPQRVARAGFGVMRSLHEQLGAQLRQMVYKMH